MNALVVTKSSSLNAKGQPWPGAESLGTYYTRRSFVEDRRLVPFPAVSSSKVVSGTLRALRGGSGG